MATIPSDAYRASTAPFNADTVVTLLAVTEAGDAAVALATGVYELRVLGAGSRNAFVALGASAAAAAATLMGGNPARVFLVGPGDVVTIYHDATRGDGQLHAVLDDVGEGMLLATLKAGA